MNYWKSISKYIQKKKEENFWRHPDCFLAAIILNEDKEQVYGIVKNDLALLECIPKPETGFFYKDVVKVEGPKGKQIFRDEEIDEYQAIELYKASNIPTFTFSAVIPDSKDYFRFLDWFKESGHNVEFPWSSNDNCIEWRKGRCTAENIEQAKEILNGFILKKEGRQVKDINYWDFYLKIENDKE
jgi:hypothetical protein